MTKSAFVLAVLLASAPGAALAQSPAPGASNGAASPGVGTPPAGSGPAFPAPAPQTTGQLPHATPSPTMAPPPPVIRNQNDCNATNCVDSRGGG